MENKNEQRESVKIVRPAFLEFKKILSDLRLKRQKTLADFLRKLKEEKLENLRRKLKS